MESHQQPEPCIQLSLCDLCGFKLLGDAQSCVFIQLYLGSEVYLSEGSSSALESQLRGVFELESSQDKGISYFGARHKARNYLPVVLLHEGSELVFTGDVLGHSSVSIVERNLIIEPIVEHELPFTELHLRSHEFSFQHKVEVFAILVRENVRKR